MKRVKALLAHIEGDVTTVYDQYDMLDEKHAAVIALGQAVSKVVAKRAGDVRLQVWQ